MKIRLTKEAGRALRRSNKRDLIGSKIEALANEPDSLKANVTKLVGRDDFRLRVQDWRIIFRIVEGELWIDLIEPRGAAYED